MAIRRHYGVRGFFVVSSHHGLRERDDFALADKNLCSTKCADSCLRNRPLDHLEQTAQN